MDKKMEEKTIKLQNALNRVAHLESQLIQVKQESLLIQGEMRLLDELQREEEADVKKAEEARITEKPEFPEKTKTEKK